MKQNKLFLGLATIAAALTFTSCSSDEQELLSQPSNARAIHFTTSLSTTRAITDPQGTNSLATGLNVGIFGVSSEETTTMSNYVNNKYVTAENNAINLASGASEMTWPTTADATASIYAYAPYQDGWTVNTANTFTIKSDQSSTVNYLASDLLYASKASQAQGTKVALPFDHKLSQIKVTINKQEGSNVDLTAAQVTITNTLPTTTLTPSSGELGTASGAATDITLVDGSSVKLADTGGSAYGVIVPQTVNAGTELVKIVSGGKTLIAKLGTNTTFASGKSYSFTVNVGNVEDETPAVVTVALGTTSVTNWDNTDNTLGAVSFPRWYATFGTPASNGKYEGTTYTWTGSTSNLMSLFTFTKGELVNYNKLVFKLADMGSGSNVRINFAYGSGSNENMNITTDHYNDNNSSFGSNGSKTISMSYVTTALNTVGKSLSDVTSIRLGGSSNSGSCTIVASDFYLTTEE